MGDGGKGEGALGEVDTVLVVRGLPFPREVGSIGRIYPLFVRGYSLLQLDPQQIICPDIEDKYRTFQTISLLH